MLKKHVGVVLWIAAMTYLVFVALVVVVEGFPGLETQQIGVSLLCGAYLEWCKRLPD